MKKQAEFTVNVLKGLNMEEVEVLEMFHKGLDMVEVHYILDGEEKSHMCFLKELKTQNKEAEKVIKNVCEYMKG